MDLASDRLRIKLSGIAWSLGALLHVPGLALLGQTD
jgi:hypothetical protein